MRLRLDVDAFGIDNTGGESTETTLGINRAFKYAVDEGFTELFIPKGTYLINGVNSAAVRPEDGGGIRAVSNLKVITHPESEFNVEANGSTGYSLLYVGPDVKNFEFEGGKFNGERYQHDYSSKPAKRETHEWGFGVHMKGAKDVTISKVKIKDFTGDGIIISAYGMLNVDYGPPYQPSERITVEKCVVDGCRRNNIAITAGEDVTIDRVHILNAGINADIDPAAGIDIEGYGEGDIDFEEPRNVKIHGCTFRGNRKDALCNFSGYNVIVTGNFSDGPISYGNGTDMVIGDNTFTRTDNTRTAIAGQKVSNGMTGNNVTIIGNTIKGFSSGIDARGADVNITGNTISELGPNGSGINVYQALNVNISNNNIQHSKGRHYKIQESTDVKIDGGSSLHSDVTGVDVVWSKLVKIKALDIKNSKQGVNIKESSVNVIDCEIDLSEYGTGVSYGVAFDKNSDVSIDGTRILNSRNLAIYGGTQAGKKVRIANNKILDCLGGGAISIVDSSPEEVTERAKPILFNNEVSYNRATGGGYAITLKGTKKADLIENTVYSTNGKKMSAAIKTDEASESRILNNTVTDGKIAPSGTDVLNENIEIL
ncbi:tail spike protein [Bacillus phage SP-10]|uniref:tail spike protein n=1 Tax=Bacillus phage SP10 TaxID=941058 RepID=UPI0002198B28|nr:tail spike protein [Bacillus phage SP-10]BAK52896.1 hypothetical protein [Bacillus phage SP-10]